MPQAADLPDPYGCAVCGTKKEHHGRRWDSETGMHQWIRPTDRQIKQRMRVRRTARLTAVPAKYHATTAWAADHTGEEGIPYCADCRVDTCWPWVRVQARLDEQRWGIPRRIPARNASNWGADADMPF